MECLVEAFELQLEGWGCVDDSAQGVGILSTCPEHVWEEEIFDESYSISTSLLFFWDFLESGLESGLGLF